MSQSVLSVGALAIVLAYLAAIVCLTTYVWRFHPATWVALERPGQRPGQRPRPGRPFMRIGFLILIFAFTGTHQSLRDRRLTSLVWVIRMLAAVIVLFSPIAQSQARTPHVYDIYIRKWLEVLRLPSHAVMPKQVCQIDRISAPKNSPICISEGALPWERGDSRMRIRSLVEGAAVLAIGALALDIGVDWLDAPEKTCRDELLKNSRMAGTTDVWIKEHYDFWTKTLSGGGWMMPWISRPYETPKVSLIVDFTREQRPHHASIDCIFAKLPNTGEPPQIALQDVRFLSEDVLERTPRGELVWTPWPPRPADANTASPRGH